MKRKKIIMVLFVIGALIIPQLPFSPFHLRMIIQIYLYTMLAMGRALMNNPTLLLLDESSLGLAPLLVKSIFQLIKKINHKGTTVLLVEQNAHMALSIAHRGYVIENGTIRMEGQAESLMKDPRVQQIYLGEL